MEIHVIIPAAGIGSRMGADCPKQYLPINGKSMLSYSIQTFLAQANITQVHLCLSPHDTYYEHYCGIQDPRLKIYYCGGDTRAQTVLNTLQQATIQGWVMVHDAARPGLSAQAVQRLIDTCLKSHQGAILALPVPDTIKYTQQNPPIIEKTINRQGLYMAQTPQMFPVEVLVTALQHYPHVTDEASAVEQMGQPVALVLGHWENLKVTWPADILLLERLLPSHLA